MSTCAWVYVRVGEDQEAGGGGGRGSGGRGKHRTRSLAWPHPFSTMSSFPNDIIQSTVPSCGSYNWRWASLSFTLLLSSLCLVTAGAGQIISRCLIPMLLTDTYSWTLVSVEMTDKNHHALQRTSSQQRHISELPAFPSEWTVKNITILFVINILIFFHSCSQSIYKTTYYNSSSKM